MATDDGNRTVDPLVATADAAGIASRDAKTVARSAADTSTAAGEAVTASSAVASRAQDETARTVAATAYEAAGIAAGAAVAVQAEAVARAVEVAASAAAALNKVTAELPADGDAAAARKVADAVAAVVAADVIAQAKLTDDAAARVAQAVSMAATAAALAAVTAASKVQAAAGAAEASTHLVAGSSSMTEAASGVAVESSARASELALEGAAQLHRAPLVEELRQALERGELRLHYQGMYDIATGAVVGMEALLRWQHPTRGLLFPAEFLDVAEGPHLILPIGDWVLRTAVAQAARWQQLLGDKAPTVWANISCDQLGRRHLPDLVGQLLTDARLTPRLLGIEVTERQLARRINDVTGDLSRLRELGVALAVDDFGTGYASLDYLRRFTFDEIKIDRSFVSGIDQDRTDTAVTASIIALGRSLGLTVVGEGVETPTQLTRLRQLGCTVTQGYLRHRPTTAERCTNLLRAEMRPPNTSTRRKRNA